MTEQLMKKPMVYRYVAIVGGVLVILGSFLNWVSVSAGPFAESKNGIEGDGKITLILGVLLIVGAVIALKKPGRPWVALVFSVLALLMGIFEYIDISGDVSDIKDLGLSASVGIGVYIVILGALVGLVSSVLKAPEG